MVTKYEIEDYINELNEVAQIEALSNALLGKALESGERLYQNIARKLEWKYCEQLFNMDTMKHLSILFRLIKLNCVEIDTFERTITKQYGNYLCKVDVTLLRLKEFKDGNNRVDKQCLDVIKFD